MDPSQLCPECEEPVGREDRHCIQCGEVLKQECTSCGAKTPVQGLFCRSCGAAVIAEPLRRLKEGLISEASAKGCDAILSLDGGGAVDDVSAFPSIAIQARTVPGFAARGGMVAYLRNPLVFPVDLLGAGIPELVPVLESFIGMGRPVMVLVRNLGSVPQAAEMLLVNREKGVLQTLVAEAGDDAELARAAKSLGTRVFRSMAMPRPKEQLPSATITAAGPEQVWIVNPGPADGSRPYATSRVLVYLAGGKQFERRKKALYVSLPPI